MSEFLKPDKVYKVPIQNGELTLSPSHDFLHHWERNGAWILKYWDSTAEPPKFCNVILAEKSAQWLVQVCGLEVLERKVMYEQEHEHFMQWQEANLDELDFEVDEPTPDDTIEE